ncbi:hypothetical protein ACTMU2_29105 [Cupriavidus basilensis]
MDALQKERWERRCPEPCGEDLIRYVPDMVQRDELRAEFERLRSGDS